MMKIPDKKGFLCFFGLNLLVLAIVFLLASKSAVPGTITTSGVTAQTIIDRVRYDLNETTASFWSDTELLQWMNEAVWEIQSRTGAIEKSTVSVTLAQDDYDYSLSSFLSVETVLHDSGTTTDTNRIFTLERVDIKDLGHSKEKGRPKTFTVWADTLYIWPIPDSNQAGTTLYVFETSSPSGVTATTSPIETPTYFDHAVLLYIKAKAHFKERREALGNYYMNLFNLRIKEYQLGIIKHDVISTQ